MVKVADLILRGLIFMFAAIIMGLAGSLASTHKKGHYNPQVSYAVFCGAWSCLFGVFYPVLANFIEAIAFPIVILIIDFISWVLTLAGGAALATAIRCHSCGNMDYVNSNKVTQGSKGRCRKAQATTAFLFFANFSFLATMILSAVSVKQLGAFTLPGRSRRSAPRTGIPTMSQV